MFSLFESYVKKDDIFLLVGRVNKLEDEVSVLKAKAATEKGSEDQIRWLRQELATSRLDRRDERGEYKRAIDLLLMKEGSQMVIGEGHRLHPVEETPRAASKAKGSDILDGLVDDD